MELAASVRNLFKKRDLKDEIEKSLGEGRNYEKVLTDVFAVYAKSGFFHCTDWEATIVKSIENVSPPPQPDSPVILGADAGTDAGADDAVIADDVAPRNERRVRRRHSAKIPSELPRRSGRARWQAERYTYN